MCPGIPGAGKTIITSIVIDELWEKYGAENGVAIAFLYCDYKMQNQQTLEDLLSSVLAQLTAGVAVLPPQANTILQRRSRPTESEILEMLQIVAKEYSKIFILVDALDECGDTVRGKMLKHLFSLQSQSFTSIFATSRHLPDIEKHFNGAPSLVIRAAEDDIRQYLESQLSQMSSRVFQKSALQAEIVTQISDTVDGMFVSSAIKPVGGGDTKYEQVPAGEASLGISSG